ncbi:adenylosuccinate synthetase [Aquabacterium sp.]|uniref:adenylosuccinate synthetase n=1 Tax=Aquabacterium sp. TaxID=1872578 RepID=UPI003D6CEE02
MSNETFDLLVVDAIRIPGQVHFLRQSGWAVTHVHLEATEETLSRRHVGLISEEKPPTYAELAKNWSSRHVKDLAKLADVVIDTDRCSAEDVFARVVARLLPRPVIASPNIDILIGGQYGSEGKGNIAHYLAPEYDVLVRVGGPNAGHQVFVGRDEKPYTFRQLPSGHLGNQDAKLVIGAGAVVSLEVLLKEIGELAIPYNKLIIDHQAMIIDSTDIAWEERTLKGAIGSTAQGIGHATARKILHRTPDTDVRLAKDIPALKRYIGDTVEYFASCLSQGKKIMLEGTQGTTLSLHHGHYPHVTSRATTAAGCLAEAGLAARHVRRVMMVCRTYPIRVGDSVEGKTSGYMSQEISFEDIASRSGIAQDTLINKEVGSVSGRKRRVAEFDWAQLRRSLLLNGGTDIALTFTDYIGVNNRKAYRYEQLTDDTLRFIEEMEKVSGVPVSLISTDFSERNIIDRRMW